MAGEGGGRLFYMFYCEMMPFNKEINIFERREIVESICEGVVEPYTYTKIADSNRSNHSSQMRGRYASSKRTPIWS